MRRKITYDLVKKEFDDRGYTLLSKNYVNNSSYLEYICPHHTNKGIQKITFQNFTSGRGCTYCAKRIRKTTDEYILELAEKKPNIEVLGEYVNLKTKILHKCKICGYEWNTPPNNMLYAKNGCPKCGKRVRITHKEFVNRINENFPNIEVAGTYINYQTKIMFRCKKCGKEWEAKPNNILNGRGCPYCHCSKGEEKIQNILNNYCIKFEKEYKFDNCRYVNPLPFDFYLTDKNIIIEYDGLQHFEPCTFGGISKEKAEENFELCQLKDSIKNKYCQNNNIKLIRIPYWEFENIEQIILSSI